MRLGVRINHLFLLFQLAKIQVEQDERAEDLTESTLALIGEYNGIVETISKSFLRYDKIISDAEAEVESKKV